MRARICDGWSRAMFEVPVTQGPGVQRQTHANVKCRPSKARSAPTDGMFQKGGNRPTDGTGKSGNQRNSGNGRARVVTVESGKRCKSGFIKAFRHGDPQNEPCDNERERACRERENTESGGECQTRSG